MFSERQLEELQKLEQEWEEGPLKAALARSGVEGETFITNSGIPLKVVYTPRDIQGSDYGQDQGFPGVYPFTRGIQPTMYRGRLWTFRQYAGFGTAEE